MAFKVYAVTSIVLVNSLRDQVLKFTVNFKKVADSPEFVQALEVGVSVARARYGSDDPEIRLEHGARSVTAAELYHPQFASARVNGIDLHFSPVIVIRHSNNPDEFVIEYNVSNPGLPTYPGYTASVGV